MDEAADAPVQSVLVLEGKGSLGGSWGSMDLFVGDSIWIPQEAGACRIEGKLKILVSKTGNGEV
jgi:mannose-6-phosphate isomerase class I